ncbi:MAG: hypothetical protein PWR00_1410, partial [Thermovirga sp.]|nr:hypothetical protein [Thermovirga sp.]
TPCCSFDSVLHIQAKESGEKLNEADEIKKNNVTTCIMHNIN